MIPLPWLELALLLPLLGAVWVRRIRDANEAVQLPGALLINVRPSIDFARAWNRRLRR